MAHFKLFMLLSGVETGGTFMKQAQRICAAVLVALLLLCPAAGLAADETDNRQPPLAENRSLALLDLLFVRPVGILVTAAGLVGYVLWSPVSLSTDTAPDAWDTLVQRPADYTFQRPLGEL
jgi:hypothetical protein